MTPPGRYHLTQKLGAGGMAVVWAGYAEGAEGFRKPVVLKRIHSHLTRQQGFVEMLVREAKTTVQLDHPNIVQVLELGRDDDGYFMALERIQGCDLSVLIGAAARGGVRIPPRLAAHICREVLAALAYAHDARDDGGRPLGIVHRDVSPANVMVSEDGRVKLTDFGIAHTDAADHVSRAGLKGKIAYMSPEQAKAGALDGRSDLYAVGLLLFELLTGERALAGDAELAVLESARRGALTAVEERVGQLPEDLFPVLRRALATDVRDRYPDARSMRQELAAGAHDLESGQERLAELMSLVRPGAGGEAVTCAPPGATVADPTGPRGHMQTLVTRASSPARQTAELSRGGRRRWAWIAAPVAVVLAGWLVFLGVTRGGEAPGGATDDAAPVEGAPPSAATVEPEATPTPAPVEQPAPASVSATGSETDRIPREARVVVPADTPTEILAELPTEAPAEEPAEPALAAAGALSVIVENSTGNVRCNAPDWGERHAPFVRAEIPAGSWRLQVENSAAGLLWSGDIMVPAGGHVGVLLVHGDNGWYRR